MDNHLEKLIAEAMQLPPESQRFLVQRIVESFAALGVRDSAAPYYTDLLRTEINGMTSVTVVLPDDLAKRAQAAGLLAEAKMAELIRQALNEQPSTDQGGASKKRKLIRRNGRLVVEALPGETPITDAEVRDLLNKADW